MESWISATWQVCCHWFLHVLKHCAHAVKHTVGHSATGVRSMCSMCRIPCYICATNISAPARVPYLLYECISISLSLMPFTCAHAMHTAHINAKQYTFCLLRLLSVSFAWRVSDLMACQYWSCCICQGPALQAVRWMGHRLQPLHSLPL